jgi:TPR repeat protein
MIGLLFLAAGIAELVILYKRNEYRGFDEYGKAYTQFYDDYYDKKRKEFPWLDKWIKANGDPANQWVRVNTDKDTKVSGIAPVILSFVILAVGGIIALIVGSSSVVGFIIVGLITLAVSFFAGNKLGNKAVNVDTEHLESPSAYEPYNGLTLECPSCHCPHSWGMTQEEIIVERKETEKETTRRTTTVKGGGTDWGYGKGDATYGSSSTWVTDTYYGKEIRDLKCLNCGHTEHNEYDDEELGTDSYDEKDSRRNPPECGRSRSNKYNPPLSAWAVWLKKENQSASTSYDFTDKTPEEKAAAIENMVETGSIDVLFNTAQSADEKGDFTTAFQLYQKAAEMGHAEAQFKIGQLYLKEGVTQNKDKALEAFEKVAETGDRVAAFNLGMKYLNGDGVAVNKAKAVQWFEKAFKSDSEYAKHDFSEINESPTVVKDEDETTRVYVDGENRAIAAYFLGECYRDGSNGVTKDLKEAKSLFGTAEILGDKETKKDAKEALKDLKKLK